MTRSIHVIAAGAVLLASQAAHAQRIAPAAAHRVLSATPTSSPHAMDVDDAVGPVPWVGLGVLLGVGAVTLYWVHAYKRTPDSEDGFFIPPAVFVTIGLGGVAGGVIGYTVYEALR